MTRVTPWLVPMIGLACVLGETQAAAAQATSEGGFRFLSGQTVAPVFEGWSGNADGSYQLHFGYLNRNWVEEIYLPIGADNRIEPGDSDQGQPSFFYPRTHHSGFSVRVPSDFGDGRVVWTVTVRDEPQHAIGWLDPVWEIPSSGATDQMSSTIRPGDAENGAPTLTIDGPRSVARPSPLALIVAVRDDGLPAPRARRVGGQGGPPTLRPDQNAPKAPVNVPDTREPRGPERTPFDRVNVTWTVWRGPARVEVELDGEPTADGQAATARLRFTEPGEYLIKVVASDGRLSSSTEELAIKVE